MKISLAFTAGALALCLSSPALQGAAAPTELRTACTQVLLINGQIGAAVELAYLDNSTDEDGFEIELSPDGVSGWNEVATTLPNESYRRVIFGAGFTGTHFMRVRALSAAGGDSDWSPAVPFTVPDGLRIGTGLFEGGTVGQSLSIGSPVYFSSGPVTWSATELPPGLSIDPSSGTISGPPAAAGVFRTRVIANDGTSLASTFITLRIIAAASGPVAATTSPAPVTLQGQGPLCVDLNAFYSDPDTEQAVRIATNLGDIDTILYPGTTPATVGNFLNYVDDGDYTDVIFHRSVTAATSGVDVVQAGLMAPDGTGGYLTVPLDPGVINEPGVSNVRGTIAMAKRSGQPNSGTSQWYFNVHPNTGLDSPASGGGFTVFGRAAAPSLAVIDDLWGRPTGTYNVEIDGIPGFDIPSWPTTVVPAGATPALGELILIPAVTRIEPLAYAITGNSNPALGTAAVEGTKCVFTPSGTGSGTTDLSLLVTDLDGNTLAGSVTVCVLDLQIAAGLSPGGALAVSFDHEKTPAELVYEVQRSTNLSTWDTVWSTADGFGAPEVIGQSDLGPRWRITVEDIASTPPDPDAAYLRIVVAKTS